MIGTKRALDPAREARIGWTGSTIWVDARASTMLGLRSKARVSTRYLHPAIRYAVVHGPTLRVALLEAVRLARVEDSSLSLWLEPGAGQERICWLNRVAAPTAAARTFEFGTVQALLAIVRAFAGDTWLPNAVALQSREPLGPFSTEFYAGARASRATIQLDHGPIRSAGGGTPRARSGAVEVPPRLDDGSQPPETFVASLQVILSSYAHDGYPSVELAAEITGTSVRTLQRQLAAVGPTYTKLLRRIGFEKAVRLLLARFAHRFT